MRKGILSKRRIPIVTPNTCPGKEERRVNRRRSALAGISTVLVLGVVALVSAAWLSSGSGSGYAKATEAQDLSTLDASAKAAADLYPGADGDVVIEIDNPNPYPVRVTKVAKSGAITADAGHVPCGTEGAPTGVTFSDQEGLAIDVPAEGSKEETLNNAAHMSNASDNSCQGATFTIPVQLTGSSNAP
jgi:hypothetical protein